ncbi:hypothetical protein H9L19_01335 [Weissella diestrammenae]|uniref:Uncharacterized protein n=1 Tax=Weissella diestrammenae TaxID=1162633 RepID=A0A7G9T645_9LACO|nr:hypothetical protein [Weissella diestrammenae]MCM0582408.1 hypothetical protein [Weissella diestrammenae]QNN75570.1 hypothetical protein H9L19_01335 [Weissella diestrammenae]
MKKVNEIYLESDGIQIKMIEGETHRNDLVHLVTHEGVAKIQPNRKALINRKEFMAESTHQAVIMDEIICITLMILMEIQGWLQVLTWVTIRFSRTCQNV